MTEMELIAQTDQYRQALLEILPKLWEYTHGIPDILELFDDDVDQETIDNIDNLDEGKQNLKCELSLDAFLLHILVTY